MLDVGRASRHITLGPNTFQTRPKTHPRLTEPQKGRRISFESFVW
jgi:hypothetical protein